MGGGQGRELLVARFAIGSGSARRGEPLALRAEREIDATGATERYTELAMSGMRGFLNGRTFDMEAVAPDERIPLHKPVLWTFANVGMGMIAMPHPMHLHGVRFRVIERGPSPMLPASVAEGLIHEGYRDMFLIFPGERIRRSSCRPSPACSWSTATTSSTKMPE